MNINSAVVDIVTAFNIDRFRNIYISFLVLSHKSILKEDYQVQMIMPNIQILVSKYSILQEN